MATTSGTTAPAGAPAGDQAQLRPASGGATRRFLTRALTLREGSIIVVTVITAIYFSINAANFATFDTFKNLLPYFAPFAILAAGEVFVMINGEIDLSIGGVLLLSPFIFEKLVTGAGFALIPALVVTIIVCMLIGAVNGFFIAVVGISSFVVTLGMLFGLSGLTLVISHAAPVAMPGTSALSVGGFAQVFGGGIYSELFWALGIVILLQVALTFTRWGIYTVAVGSNRLGAAEAGINVRVILIRNFVVCAMCAGLVGILHDGLIVQGVNADYLDLYLGIAILIAMSINVYVQRVRTGRIHG